MTDINVAGEPCILRTKNLMQDLLSSDTALTSFESELVSIYYALIMQVARRPTRFQQKSL